MQTKLGRALEGRYVVDREIGRGGMATVFLARDQRHNRKVALKVLNSDLGAILGVERFLAEIEVTANLQHPNLLPLFDSGEADGLLFYVMPYIEGESLRARLEREKQLPVAEAVRIACAIAGALDYAHRHNVIHRDLKPENILMQEGQPLIADFGIALAVSNAGGSRITQTGLSLGTPLYMSPEQATGDRVVDGRSDIYSLGAMTYEMLVGDPPHAASTSQAIIARVLTETPRSVRSSRPNAPVHVDAAIARSLEKLAADRFATAKEFSDALEHKGATGPVTGATFAPPSRGARGGIGRREIVAWSVAAVLAATIGWRQFAAAAPVEQPVVRVNFDLPPAAHVNDVITGTTIAVSPKGDMIAFTSVGVRGFRVYIRHVNEIAAREVSDAAGRNLAFSPDQKWIAFNEGTELKKVSVDGGPTLSIGSTGSAVPYGISWSNNDTIYVGGFSGLWAIPASGGTATSVGGDSSRYGRRWPFVLPGGKAMVYSSGGNSAAPAHLSVLDLRTWKSVEYEPLAAMTLGLVGDQLIYVSPAGALMAVRFDIDAHKPIGDPVPVDDEVLVDPTAGAKASVSPTGTLAYLRGRAQFQPVFVSAGSTAPSAMINEASSYSTPRFSPDGRRVAYSTMTPTGSDIWVRDVARNTSTRLTSEGVNMRPEWTSDGREVIFVSTRGNKTAIYHLPSDGSGQAEVLYAPELEPYEAIMSPDRKWLLFRTAPGAKHSRDIMAVPMTGDRTVIPVVTGANTTESMPRLSPDGKWLMYQSNETGRFDVYVRPFPGNGALTPVSENGGTEPLWGRDGRTVYYRGPSGEVIEVDVTTGQSFSIGAKRVVVTGDYLTDSSHPNYDVGPDRRFVMLKRAGAESQTIVVHNWGRELREKTTPRR